jgi:hypothetical protein
MQEFLEQTVGADDAQRCISSARKILCGIDNTAQHGRQGQLLDD